MIEKLFTSKTRVKILNYLLFENPSTYTRELSSKLNIPVSAVKREVDNLRSLDIITNVKNRIGLNKGLPYLDDLKGIFIKTDGVCYPLADSLKGLDVDFAFIFGSFADGTYTAESDLDLFVAGNVSMMGLVKRSKPAEEEIKREINPVVWPTADLEKKKKSSFLRTIAKGKIIMVKGAEDELRKIIGRR